MLLEWVSSPRSTAGVREFEDPSWRYCSYPWLADRVRGVSAQLRAAGARRDDVVAIITPDCIDFTLAFFGALHAGATPLPIAPAPASARAEADRTAAAILEGVSPVLISARGEGIARARTLREAAGVRSQVVELLPEPVSDLDPAPQGSLALLQFTSGSTGRPRGVPVSHENLESNLAMLRRCFYWDSQAGGVSWLPLQHDMGLIGMLLSAICTQRDFWQMKPTDFLRDPLRWLERLGGEGASITISPTFGYSYATRRLDSAQLDGLDFSGWKTAVVGAERVIPAVLHRFAELLGDFGFRREALCPAYGMAEATLGISVHARGPVARMVRVCAGAVAIGGPLSLGETRPVTDPASDETQGAYVASCGEPLPGLVVEVVGEDGAALPEGTLGEVSVSGPSVVDGYHGDQAGISTRFVEGRLLTGDAGFLVDGELFVLGRIADSLKVRGAYVYVEDLEIRLAAALGLPLSRCVVVSVAGLDSDAAAVLIEAEEREPEAETVAAALRPALGAGVEVKVYLVERNSLVRTTSGKPQRRLIARQLAAGELEARLALQLPGDDPVQLSGVSSRV
jgi:fatty-acyl-CoA synthase